MINTLLRKFLEKHHVRNFLMDCDCIDMSAVDVLVRRVQ